MKSAKPRAKRPFMLMITILSVFSLIAASCSSDDDGDDSGGSGEGGESSSGDRVIKVATVENGPLVDIARLTPENFTSDSGITVEFTELPEQQLREVVTRDVAAGGGEFDVVLIGMYEAPIFGGQGLFKNLDDFTEGDDDYDVEDILQPVRDGLSANGNLYAAPFYAESSFLMYRQDLLDDAGVTMPEEPTWDEVAAIARQIDTEETAGICLRGLAGWGDLGASFTTVLNTFGGTWWSADADGNVDASQVDQPAFAEAANFYVDLVNDAGQTDAANSSFNQCLDQYKAGTVAMWYDATVAASILEEDDSEVQGLNGYVKAPVKDTDSSGWLWSWALAIPESNENPDDAWEFIKWATSKDYIEQAAADDEIGWAGVPPGTRQSTYDRAEYQEAAAAFADITLEAINSVDPTDPGTTPRPGAGGIQFVGIPEWQGFGTECTEQLSGAIGGSQTTEEAIAACHDLAVEVAETAGE